MFFRQGIAIKVFGVGDMSLEGEEDGGGRWRRGRWEEFAEEDCFSTNSEGVMG